MRCPQLSSRNQPLPHIDVADCPFYSAANVCDIQRIYEYTGIPDNLGQRGNVRNYDGSSASHRLDGRKAETFHETGLNHQKSSAVELSQAMVIHTAGKLHPPFDSEGWQGGSQLRRPASSEEEPQVRIIEPGKSAKQAIDVFVRLAISDVQNVWESRIIARP